MTARVTISSLYVVSIPYIREGYLSVICCVLGMSHDVFEHQLTQVELSLHAYLEKEGDEVLRVRRLMGGCQPELHIAILCKIEYRDMR